jgi:uncharacterized protein YraI
MTRFRRLVSTRQIVVVLAAMLLVAIVAPFALTSHVQAAEATAIVNTPKLNVRSGPSAFHSVVTELVQGEVVQLLGRNSDSSWAYVRTTSNLQGWASTFYLLTETQLSSLPVVATPTPQPTAVPPTAPASTPQPVTPQPAAGATAWVNAPSLNMRSGPSADYSVIMILSYGYQVNLIGRDADSAWAEVMANNVKGWVATAFIVPSVPISTLPVTSGSVPPPGGTPPTQAPGAGTPLPPNQPRGTVISQRLNVRTGPGAGNVVITTVEYGEVLPLLARNSDGSWVRVQVDSETRGWVSSLYILVPEPFELSDLPVTAEVEPSATVITGTLNIRSGPGPQYESVGTLNYGTVIGVLARNADGSWVKISVNGMKGWVDPSYLAIDFQIASLPVVNH